MKVEPDLGERGSGVADLHGEVGGAVQRREEVGQGRGVARRGEVVSSGSLTTLNLLVSVALFYTSHLNGIWGGAAAGRRHLLLVR